MCGIAGIWHLSQTEAHLLNKTHAMKKALLHRGPDGEGLFYDKDANMALAHRRLAIFDPALGKQPMNTADGALSIVFNGAIYNFLELRQELISLGHSFQTQSDTEVLLYAYRAWGEACLSKLNGMFAFVIWDKKEQTLFAARDRVGIKPFYYCFSDNYFVFASEIKAILSSGEIDAVVNPDALQDYINFQYTLGNKTLFNSIYKLLPGHSLTVKNRGKRLVLEDKVYWDLNFSTDQLHDEPYFLDKLNFLLQDAISLQLRSDVPLGAHLSGGLDSSTVVSIAAAKLDRPLNTFTGFFDGKKYDETAYARLVAEKSGCNYNAISMPVNEFFSILPQLIYFMDEPAAGHGLLPQYFVSKAAAKQVKVLLGGQGGDELFTGYARYLIGYLENALKKSIFSNSSANEGISLGMLAPGLHILHSYTPMLQYFWSENLFGEDAERYYRLINRTEEKKQFFNPDIFTSGYSSFEEYKNIFNHNESQSLVNKMMYYDFKSFLPSLLQVEDRTSMSVSIESRVPLLDHRIVELMASIPEKIKFSNGELKYLFKKVIRNHIPQEIYNRKDKMGFPFPLMQYIKENKEYIHELLFSQSTVSSTICDMKKVEAGLQSGQLSERFMWGTICLELWMRIFIDKSLAL